MKSVVVRGPIFSKSGYGEHVRCIVRALLSREDLFDICVVPTVWGNTSWRYEETEENKKFTHLCEKAQSLQHRPDISLQVCIPNEWNDMADLNIGVTAAVETTAASHQWLQYCNHMDHIIVVSDHAKKSLKDPIHTGTFDGKVVDIKCDTDVDIVGYPVKEYDTVDLDLGLTTDFNFLTVAQDSPRKNLSATIRSFLNEFKDDENVGLVLKLNKMNDSLLDREQSKINVRRIIAAEKHQNVKCKIYLLHGPMTEQEIHSLYKHDSINAYISTTHGEGYGLPIFEAAYSGLPILAPAWSGHTDFLYMPEENKVSKRIKKEAKFLKIRYELKPVQEEAVWEGVIIPESRWAFVDLLACQKMMRHMYKTERVQKKRALQLQKYLQDEYSPQKINERIVEIITNQFEDEDFSMENWLSNMENDLEINE